MKFHDISCPLKGGYCDEFCEFFFMIRMNPECKFIWVIHDLFNKMTCNWKEKEDKAGFSPSF